MMLQLWTCIKSLPNRSAIGQERTVTTKRAKYNHAKRTDHVLKHSELL
jgi:hypothetical protein